MEGQGEEEVEKGEEPEEQVDGEGRETSMHTLQGCALGKVLKV